MLKSISPLNSIGNLIYMELPVKTKFSIKHWAEEDRPREKLMLKGRNALSDAELIAILLGSGTKTLSAVDVAKLLLNHAENDLHKLARFTIKDMKKIDGIGEARAITIISALELGRRRKETEREKEIKITSSQDAYRALRAEFMDLPREEFWVLLLNRANIVLKKQQISSGGVSGTVADPKIIFQSALEANASSIILAHNHPSGNLRPSEADIRLTKKVKDAGNTLDLPILDHLIVTDSSYLSFADEGYL